MYIVIECTFIISFSLGNLSDNDILFEPWYPIWSSHSLRKKKENLQSGSEFSYLSHKWCFFETSSAESRDFFGWVARLLRLSGTSVTFGPSRRLALRHAGSLSVFGAAFFGQAILVFSDFPFNPSREKEVQSQPRSHQHPNNLATCRQKWDRHRHPFLRLGKIAPKKRKHGGKRGNKGNR